MCAFRWTRCTTVVPALLAASFVFVCAVFHGRAAGELTGRDVLQAMRQKTDGTAQPAEEVNQMQAEPGPNKPPSERQQPERLFGVRGLDEPAGECKLRYVLVRRSDAPKQFPRRYCETTAQQPSQLSDLPPDVPQRAAFFSLRFGDREVIGVTYASAYVFGKVKLCLDGDGDGSLRGEREYVARTVRWFRFGPALYYVFGPVTVHLHNGEGGSKAVFFVKTRDGSQLEFYPAGYRYGLVRTGGKVYKVAVLDGDFDGRYDRTVSLPVEDVRKPGCDLLAIDLDRDGTLDWDTSPWAYSEVMPLARMVVLDETFYSVDIAPDGGTLELEQVEPEFGTLEFETKDVGVKLWSDAAHLYLQGPASKWLLPAGRYTALSMNLILPDAAGDKWALTSRRDTGKLKDFQIEPGRTLSLKVGPPFRIKTEAGRRADKILIGFDLEGQAGEKYDVRATRGRRTAPNPRLKIIDESGRLLESGKFEFG